MPEFHGKLGIVFKDDIKGGAIEIGEKKGQMEIKVESHGKAVKENGIFPFRRKFVAFLAESVLLGMGTGIEAFFQSLCNGFPEKLDDLLVLLWKRCKGGFHISGVGSDMGKLAVALLG